MKNNTILNMFAGLVLPAVFALAIIAMPIAVHAQEFGDSGDGGCCDFGTTDYGSTFLSPTDYGSTYLSPTDYGSTYLSPTDYSYPASTDYSYPASTDYSYPASTAYSYGGSGYSYPSYSYGGYSYPGFASAVPYLNTPAYPASSNSNVFAPTTVNTNTNVNDNTCTGGSCNTNIVTTNPAPVINNVIAPSTPSYSAPVVYSAPVYYQPNYPVQPQYNYPTCTLTVTPQNPVYGQPVTLSWSSNYASSGWISMVGNVAPSGSTQVTPGVNQTYTATFYGYNGQSTSCSAYVNVTRPVAYNPTPYITLSAVPYTGLDLGPWGTAAYWGFLIVWCLFAAYLIAIKRVQVSVARSLKGFLFGTGSVAHTAHESHSAPAHDTHAPAHAAHAHVTHVEHAPVVHASEDKTDEFILSQIFRAAR